MRRRIFTAFELAENETDPGRRKQLLTFVIICDLIIRFWLLNLSFNNLKMNLKGIAECIYNPECKKYSMKILDMI